MLQCNVAAAINVKRSALRVLSLGVLTMGQLEGADGGRGGGGGGGIGDVVQLWAGHMCGVATCSLVFCAVNKSLSIDLEDQGVTCVLLHPGYVRTDMTSQNGLIDVDESVSGLISVLESDMPLNGKWYDFKREVIPW